MNSVMVLDGDGNTQLLLQRLLESEGFSVSTVETLAELTSFKVASSVDLYILDPTLMGAGGLDLIRQIRSRSSSGIILLSPDDNETCLVKGFELGADDFIRKPFRPRELAARVKAVHRRTSSARTQYSPEGGEGVVTICNYRLYLEDRTVLDVEGREIALTTAEFNILQVLATRRGEVLTREEIIGLSKGRDWQCYERSVDGLISRLRRKLPVQDGMAHFIKTVHGTGYTIAKREMPLPDAPLLGAVRS